MSRIPSPALSAIFLCLFACSIASSAQIYKLHNADVTVNGTGPFTTTLTTNGSAVQKTTDSTGFLFTLRDHPVAWAGVEFNYGYDRFSENFVNTVGSTTYSARVGTNVHEATAAYLFHPHFMHLQPFLAVGGGALDFIPVHPAYNQWRGAGLVELGFDIPTSNPHFGFRVQGRSLIYRAPNYNTPTISSRSWVATDEPSLGAFIRF